MATRGLSDSLSQDFSRQTKHHWNWASAWAWAKVRAWARASTGTRARARTQGKRAGSPTHAVAQSAVADSRSISMLYRYSIDTVTIQEFDASLRNSTHVLRIPCILLKSRPYLWNSMHFFLGVPCVSSKFHACLTNSMHVFEIACIC